MSIGKIRIITVLVALSSCALLAERVVDADAMLKRAARERNEALRDEFSKWDSQGNRIFGGLNAALIEKLLAAGADPNITDLWGEPILSRTGNEEIIELLLRYGADPNTRSRSGKTALHQSFLCDGKARALASAGGDVNAVCDSGFTPLMYAVSKQGYVQSQCVYSHVNDLLELGVDPLQKTPGGRNLLIIYFDDFKSEYYSRHDRTWRPPEPKMAKLLLEAGINPLERDSSGRSALRLAFKINGNHFDIKPLREMLTAAALAAAGNETEAAAVEKLIREEKRLGIADRPPRDPGEYLFFLPAALLLCYIGFSVAARERIYRGRHKDNWVGSVNGFVAGFILGAYAAGLLQSLIGLEQYEAHTLLIAAAGLAAGWWMSGKRETFNKYASLYYGLPLLLAIPIWGITLFFTL